MPETIEIQTYTAAELQELEPTAFDHAFNDFCANVEFSWSDEWRESLKGFADHFGLKIGDWSVDLCGPSYCKLAMPDCTIAQDMAEMSPVRLWKYLHNSGLLSVPETKWSETEKRIVQTGRAVSLLDGQCPFTGYCGDEDLLDPLRAFVKNPADTWPDLIEACADSWARAFASDMEHHFSEENFIDMAETNGWRFDETGRLI